MTTLVVDGAPGSVTLNVPPPAGSTFRASTDVTAIVAPTSFAVGKNVTTLAE